MSSSKTIELARKLNAIELIDVNELFDSNRQTAQYFDYLLVLDFEATCWYKSNNKEKKNEIIEFSLVLYDVNEGEIIDEFQQYVKPTEFPILSEFCTDLTGITQSQVNDGVNIGACLTIFSKWIDVHKKNLNISFPCDLMLPGKKKCAFATWSDWDLGYCLFKECSRKNIYKQDFFNKWIDVKQIYMEHYYKRPMGLLGAVEDVGLYFVGNQHCGLDDAKNTAYLIREMIKHGALLRITSDINNSNKKKK